jgi:large subunit ribosomal protein L7Ae
VQEDGCPVSKTVIEKVTGADSGRYCIVKGKARLGLITGKKTSAVVAVDDVRSEDAQALANLVSACTANYLDKADEIRRHWGGGIRGNKS